jgi:hypothetical protein
MDGALGLVGADGVSAFEPGEGVALGGVAAFEAAVEPADTLLGGAVGEGLGADVALRHSLEAVVADGGGGIKAGFDVGLVDHLAVGGGGGPDAGETVGLQLGHDGELVLGAGILTLKGAHLTLDAEHVLHVVADFMSDNVGLSKVAGGTEAAELIPEARSR